MSLLLRLYESLKTPYAYKPVFHKERVSGGQIEDWETTFATDDGSTVNVSLSSQGYPIPDNYIGIHVLGFDRNGKVETTNQGDAFRILSTVVNFVVDVVDHNNIDVIAIDVDRTDESRYSVYKRIASLICNETGSYRLSSKNEVHELVKKSMMSAISNTKNVPADIETKIDAAINKRLSNLKGNVIYVVKI